MYRFRFLISGIFLLLILVLFYMQVSPKDKGTEPISIASEDAPSEKNGLVKGNSVLRSLQSGIESSRAANEDMAARHAQHHQDGRFPSPT